MRNIISDEAERNEFRVKFQSTIPSLPESKSNAVLTFPDGKTVDLPIHEATIGPPVLNIQNLYSQSGYFTFDPGFTSTASCLSRIAYIDGPKGKLLYRGYTIEELAEKCSYIEVCYLLIYGNLPRKQELFKFEETVYF